MLYNPLKIEDREVRFTPPDQITLYNGATLSLETHDGQQAWQMVAYKAQTGHLLKLWHNTRPMLQSER